MDKGTKEIVDTLNLILARMTTKDDIVNMATKDDIAALQNEMHEGFASTRTELRNIRDRLEALEETARNSAGLTKEIDHIMERVRAIEKHLGIQQRIAA